MFLVLILYHPCQASQARKKFHFHGEGAETKKSLYGETTTIHGDDANQKKFIPFADPSNNGLSTSRRGPIQILEKRIDSGANDPHQARAMQTTIESFQTKDERYRAQKGRGGVNVPKDHPIFPPDTQQTTKKPW